ncbi:DUF397 domain-containing protein [Sphaerisporangium sp. NPDC051017]|uniref:DUF397 domain-containing protein n=1 Tax=Sphaerisporangium sp. NPDC051017 TaxID=3154636 RepID=UPI00343777EA
MGDVIHEFDDVVWRKSSFSGGDGSSCVEVARVFGGRRAVQDSKNLDRAVLVVPGAAWGPSSTM